MGMHALGLFKIMGVRQGFKEERKSIIISKNTASVHVGVYIERGVGDVRVREGSNEIITNENMGSV